MQLLISDKDKTRIADLVICLKGNLKACSEQTKIDARTIKAIYERGHASPGQLSRILAFCDKVEGLTVHNYAD